MINKNISTSFFFVCSFLFIPTSKCSEKLKKIDLQIKQSKKVTVQLSLLDPNDTNLSTAECRDCSIVKIDHNTYKIRVGNDSPFSIVIDKDKAVFVDAMKEKAQSHERKNCYISIKIQNQIFYLKINETTLQEAIESQPVFSKDRPQKSIPQPELQPEMKKSPITPIPPTQFKLPHPKIHKDSSAEELSHSDINNIRNRIEQSVSEQTEQALQQELDKQKEENDAAIKGLDEFLRSLYQTIIENSLSQWPDAPEKHILTYTAQQEFKLLKENPQNPEKIRNMTENEYYLLCYNKHLSKIASWNIKKFNELNDIQKQNNLPPITYQEYTMKVGMKIKKSEKTVDSGPNTDRFVEMQNATNKQFKRIEEIEKTTNQTQFITDNYYMIVLPKRAQIYTEQLGRTLVMEQGALLILNSLYPTQEMDREIEKLEKHNKHLEKIIKLKKEFLALEDTPEEYEKKINDSHYDLVMQNQKILDKHTKKKKNKKELLQSLQEQRDKRVQS